jgi:hypothetical protein
MELQNAAPPATTGMPASRRRLRIALVLIGLILIGAASVWRLLSLPRPAEPVLVARVGDRPIGIEAFQREMVRRGGSRPELLDKNALLEEMIATEAGLARALALGLDRDPEVLHAYRSLLIGTMRTRELQPCLETITVTEAEIKAAYEQSLDRFTQPAKARLALLYLQTNAKMSDAKRTELRAHLEEAKTKAVALPPTTRNFGALAIEYSDDQASRYRGGDVGWVSVGQELGRWPKDVIAAGLALPEVGAVSELLDGPEGIYLVRLVDRRDSSVRPLESVSEQIRHQLLLQKRKEAEQAFAKGLLAGIQVKVYRDVLDRVPLPASRQRAADQPPPPPQ